MKDLLQLAVTGTRHGAAANLSTGTRLDDVLAPIDADVEHRILRTAGSWDVFERAGRQAPPAPELPEPAAAESRPPCSPRVAVIVRELLETRWSDRLLVEAGRLLDAAGLRLPPELLPAVLDMDDEAIREALRPALGERGRWLAGFRSEWSWAARATSQPERLPDDADEMWEEGSHAERIDLLREARRLDPDRARRWVEGVWKSEKVKARLEMLGNFTVGLTAADETFLESCLDDRSIRIRSAAAEFLATVEGSAFARRMRERAERLLAYERPGRWRVELPEELDKGWERDGVRAAVPAALSLGPRAYWFSQVLRQVPPSHFSHRLKQDPRKLLKALVSNEWAPLVAEAWTLAAARLGCREWLAPLWDWWIRVREGSEHEGIVERMLVVLMPRLAAGEREERAVAVVRRGARSPIRRSAILGEVPAPWPAALARAWLEAVCKEIKRSSFDAADELWPELEAHADALPSAVLDEAAQPWPEPHPNWWAADIIERKLGRFLSVVEVRRTLRREIGA